ncbi:MAG: NAD(P)-binding protein [Tannerellaceae bacterium]|nr:NAD(P)-binding protein [Tannerellaceae bacterium]MCD8265278.1 NAD(P)-binding protein [Tannerellaceae bacterium]
MKVAVIGVGIGGLAIAIRMAVKGYRVTLFEQAACPGGKVVEIKKRDSGLIQDLPSSPYRNWLKSCLHWPGKRWRNICL